MGENCNDSRYMCTLGNIWFIEVQKQHIPVYFEKQHSPEHANSLTSLLMNSCFAGTLHVLSIIVQRPVYKSYWNIYTMFCTTKMKNTWHQQKHYIAYCKKVFFSICVIYATELSLKDRTDEVMCNIKQGLVLLKKYCLLLSDVINSIRSNQSKHSLRKIPYPNFYPCTYQTLLRLPVWHKKRIGPKASIKIQ